MCRSVMLVDLPAHILHVREFLFPARDQILTQDWDAESGLVHGIGDRAGPDTGGSISGKIDELC